GWYPVAGRAKEKRRPEGRRFPILGLRGSYWKRRSTFWSACEASDRAVVDSCWRVCRARRFAPSWFESASVRSFAPVWSVLIVALVKSWRICTVERLAPRVWACERRVVRAVVSWVDAVEMSDAPAQLLAAPLSERAPALVSVTPDTVTLDEPVSFNVTVRLLPLSRLMPLKPESPARVSICALIAPNWVERLRRVGASEVCCAWLIRACADCTSLVIEVRPLLAAWIVLMPFDIES